uniref:Cytochrome c oxidase subunit 2 n=1 Tax=Holochlora fruhstorferi TaxID=1945530 RepID=A0A1Q1MPR4_9ORTH|nr:cytochrome c oxidase subunit II [Holochlora fruhstorferi]AQM40084.1 cytochrome c oxidase subunit 2 [Holochlora fruhstorferi]
MATWSNLNLQNSTSPMMEQLTFFHDHALMILLMITILVAYIMSSLFSNPHINRFLLQGQTIEIIWTIFPAITLFFIALPSLRLLYMLDETLDPIITVKTVGHQWYWSYEYSDLTTPYEFDTYMIPLNEMNNNSFRLLDVDNRTVLPMLVQVRLLITAADVLHSWTVPTLGVKVDATPGRLNQTSFLMNRPGVFYGQCSEICGANHSFMPIVIESVDTKTFIKWLSNNLNS